MFIKTDFQKATSTLAKAESEVRRRRDVLAQTDLAIERAIQENAASDQAAIAATLQIDSIAEFEARLDEISAIRARMERRVDELQRLRAHQMTSLRQAQIDVLDAESSVHAAQRTFFEDAAKDALQKCVQQCREPLLELQRFSAAAAYHGALAYGKHQARSAWSGVDAFEVLRTALDNFDERLSVEEKIKNAPPISAVCSDEISVAEREAAAVLKGKGGLSAGTMTAALTVRESPQEKSSNSDDRYRAGFQVEYWRSVIERIERSVEEERVREYASFGADGPINSAAVRKRNLEELQRKLNHAKACMNNWQTHVDQKAAA